MKKPSARKASTSKTPPMPPRLPFVSESVVSPQDLLRLILMRASQPGEIDQALAARRRRSTLAPAGKLVILAADHPARMVTALGADPVGMADRADYLARIVRVLQASPVDGLMATPEIIEDVAALNAIGLAQGRKDFLADRLLIGSMNRAGFNGARQELYDPPSAYLTAEHLVRYNLDGGKVLWRYCSSVDNRLCLATFEALAAVAAQLGELKLPLFIEPLAVLPQYADEAQAPANAEDSSRPAGRRTRRRRSWAMSGDLADWIKVVSAAAALGPTSARNWLKIPYLRSSRGANGRTLTFADVAAATTLPVLMLGGPSVGDFSPLLADFAAGMMAAPNVLGALVGRNILYPGEADPALAARAVCHVVHGGMSAAEAARAANSEK